MARIFIVTVLIIFINSCAENKNIFTSGNSIQLGTESTLDVITWNIENFPKQNDITIDYLVKLINSMNVDIIALQEIANSSYFRNLVDSLDGWSGYRSPYNNGWNLAYIYKNSSIEKLNIYEIYTSESRPFPRPPLVIEFKYRSIFFTLINNHLKCCGDGDIDEDNYWDEEHRRRDANVMLDDYISTHFANVNLILVGDLNDNLNDPDNSNIFLNFIQNSDNYQFIDMNIALGSSSNWSWPGINSSYSASHFDHILITNELFDEFENEGSLVQTIRLEEYFDGGWSDYEKYISDHRPVGLSLKFNP